LSADGISATGSGGAAQPGGRWAVERQLGPAAT